MIGIDEHEIETITEVVGGGLTGSMEHPHPIRRPCDVCMRLRPDIFPFFVRQLPHGVVIAARVPPWVNHQQVEVDPIEQSAAHLAFEYSYFRDRWEIKMRCALNDLRASDVGITN